MQVLESHTDSAEQAVDQTVVYIDFHIKQTRIFTQKKNVFTNRVVPVQEDTFIQVTYQNISRHNNTKYSPNIIGFTEQYLARTKPPAQQWKPHVQNLLIWFQRRARAS